MMTKRKASDGMTIVLAAGEQTGISSHTALVAAQHGGHGLFH